MPISQPKTHHGHPLGLLCLCLAVSLTGLTLPAQAQSNCRATYTQATDLLDSTTQKAANNEHPDNEAFSGNFKQFVDKLQSDKCLPELMSLIQHIQSEQQKYPAPAAGPAKPLPIVD